MDLSATGRQEGWICAECISEGIKGKVLKSQDQEGEIPDSG